MKKNDTTFLLGGGSDVAKLFRYPSAATTFWTIVKANTCAVAKPDPRSFLPMYQERGLGVFCVFSGTKAINKQKKARKMFDDDVKCYGDLVSKIREANHHNFLLKVGEEWFRVRKGREILNSYCSEHSGMNLLLTTAVVAEGIDTMFNKMCR